MLAKLIERPIAVTMTVIAVIVVGIVSIGQLPVSLMPDVEIPQVTVQLEKPGFSAREMDNMAVQPLRSQLLQIPHISSLTCKSYNNGGLINIQFDYGTDTDYNFIEVNERVDRALQSLPDGMERPKVIKASILDLPVLYIDITSAKDDEASFIELGKYVREVLIKRFEQIKEIAVVDVSGIQSEEILVEPYEERLLSLGLENDDLIRALNANNVLLGNLTLKFGHYQWSIRFDSEIHNKEDIEGIVLNVNGRLMKFKELAKVSTIPLPASGLVRSNGKRAVSMAVIKQSEATISDTRAEIEALIDDINKTAPDICCTITKNQTELLEYSISNLKVNILIGALLAILILFLFMRDWSSPLLVALTVPLTIVASLLLLYIMGISINVISLSGLLLGVGMMIDNSIIVIDNINQYISREKSCKFAIVNAVKEVRGPMLSSVLTTCAVFVPLIFLSGITGSLFYDQAMAMIVTLFVSLIVSIFILPVYCHISLKRGSNRKIELPWLIRFDRVYTDWYEKWLKIALRRQTVVWAILWGLLLLSAIIVVYIPKSKMPPVTHTEMMVYIDWNAPVSIEENDASVTSVMQEVEQYKPEWEALIGTQDFLLSREEKSGSGKAVIYVKTDSEESVENCCTLIEEKIKSKFPTALVEVEQADNVFNLVFANSEANLVAMIRGKEGSLPSSDDLNAFLEEVRRSLPDLYIEPVAWQEQILLKPDREKMAFYGLSYNDIFSHLSTVTNERSLFVIKSGSIQIPVVMGKGSRDILATAVKNAEGVYVPLSHLLSEHRVRDLKTIVSGKDGAYYPLNINAPDKRIHSIKRTLDSLAEKHGNLDILYSGAYFSGRSLISELSFVLVIALLLLFFILAAQFESVVQPFIILSEVLFDLAGALFMLWLFGAGLNLMSLIGMVVMCGIVINDSILKVDTINHHLRSGNSLLKSILVGGRRRLKPILMTSLTTILAIAPFLVRGSLGSDLQYPFSIAIMGGLLLGTLVSLFFVPVLYYQLYRFRK